MSRQCPYFNHSACQISGCGCRFHFNPASLNEIVSTCLYQWICAAYQCGSNLRYLILKVFCGLDWKSTIAHTCDTKFLGADADLLFVCREQNRLSIRTSHLEPLTLSLDHFWTWGRDGQGQRRPVNSRVEINHLVHASPKATSQPLVHEGLAPTTAVGFEPSTRASLFSPPFRFRDITDDPGCISSVGQYDISHIVTGLQACIGQRQGIHPGEVVSENKAKNITFSWLLLQKVTAEHVEKKTNYELECH